MAKLTSEVRTSIETLGAMALATATPDGKPNVNMVAYVRIIDDETIEIADNFFYKTRQNLDANPQLALMVWGAGADGCYQVKGTVKLYTEGEVFDACTAWAHTKNPNMNPKASVRLTVTEIYSGKDQIA